MIYPNQIIKQAKAIKTTQSIGMPNISLKISIDSFMFITSQSNEELAGFKPVGFSQSLAKECLFKLLCLKISQILDKYWLINQSNSENSNLLKGYFVENLAKQNLAIEGWFWLNIIQYILFIERRKKEEDWLINQNLAKVGGNF